MGRKVCLGILKKQLKYSSFRPGQLEAILPALHGEDVFVRMGTGLGKTLRMYASLSLKRQVSLQIIFRMVVVESKLCVTIRSSSYKL